MIQRACIICGDRRWDKVEPIRQFLRDWSPHLVIEGEAAGADKMGRRQAEMQGCEVEPFPADWERYGRAAGPIRNEQMLKRLVGLGEEGWEIFIAAFHGNISESKGTANMILLAEKNSVPFEVFT